MRARSTCHLFDLCLPPQKKKSDRHQWPFAPPLQKYLTNQLNSYNFTICISNLSSSPPQKMLLAIVATCVLCTAKAHFAGTMTEWYDQAAGS